MKMHVEYDDFGEYLEVLDQDELYVADEYTPAKVYDLSLVLAGEPA